MFQQQKAREKSAFKTENRNKNMKSMICIYLDKLQIQVEFWVLRKNLIYKNFVLVYLHNIIS